MEMVQEDSSPTLDAVLAKALEESNAASKQDALLVTLHSILLSAGFVCVASGDEGFGDGAIAVGEAVSTPWKPGLPIGWNSSQEVCSLQYRHNPTKQKCLVKTIPLGDQLLISAVVASHMERPFSYTIMPSKYVKDGTAYDKPSVYMNLLELMSTLKGEIEVKLSQQCELSLGAVSGSQVAAPQSQSAPSLAPGRGEPSPHFPPAIDPLGPGPSSRPDPLEIRDPLRIGPTRPHGDPDVLGEFGPFGYGDRDRFPAVGGGGGMIFDPRRNPGMRVPPSGVGPLGPYPPGHPPGARFDPVSPLRPPIRPPPPHPGRNPPGAGYYGPSPDHLPPPGYDDMFS